MSKKKLNYNPKRGDLLIISDDEANTLTFGQIGSCLQTSIGGGSGAVNSVNGKTGTVVLTGEDIKENPTSDNTISDSLQTNAFEISNLAQTKQDKLTAGTNITISDDNVISATGSGAAYTAGDNIQISDTNVISATGIDHLSSSVLTGTTYNQLTIEAYLTDGTHKDTSVEIPVSGGTGGISNVSCNLSVVSFNQNISSNYVECTINYNSNTDTYTLIITGSLTCSADPTGEWDVNIYRNNEYYDYMEVDSAQYTITNNTITFNLSQTLTGSDTGTTTWLKNDVIQLMNYDSSDLTFTASNDFDLHIYDANKTQVLATINNNIADITAILPTIDIDGKMNKLESPTTTNLLISNTSGQAVESEVVLSNAMSEFSLATKYYEAEIYEADNDKLGLSLTKFVGDNIGSAGVVNIKATKGETYDLDNTGEYTAGTDISIVNNAINSIALLYSSSTQKWAGTNANGLILYAPDGTSLITTDADVVNYKDKGEIATKSDIPTNIPTISYTSTRTAVGGTPLTFNDLTITLTYENSIYTLTFTSSNTIAGQLNAITTAPGLSSSIQSGSTISISASHAGMYTGQIITTGNVYIISGDVNDEDPAITDINITRIGGGQ